MWFAEKREGIEGDWEMVGGPYKSQKTAKGVCRKLLSSSPNKNILEFRTFDYGKRGKVYHHICFPPHGARLRWINA